MVGAAGDFGIVYGDGPGILITGNPGGQIESARIVSESSVISEVPAKR